jgi:DNA-binding transcriptional LysR family regulator
MSDTLALYATFVQVVEVGSFTAVAASQGVSQPTISRQIAALEAHLGALLFQRTTRALTLTEEGRAFYDRARAALAAVAEAETAVGRRKGRPGGVLRLACAAVMARLHVLPRLGRFFAAYPDIDVHLTVADDVTNLVGEGVDLAIRVGALTDPNLIARRIGLTRRMIVAAPAYLARRGEPQSPDDLAVHDCIVYDRLSTGANWPLTGPQGRLLVPVRGRLRVDSTEAVRAAALDGLGVALVPVWHFTGDELATGRLKRLLPDYRPESHPIHAVYSSRRFLADRVRVMLDFLRDEFAIDPVLQDEAACDEESASSSPKGVDALGPPEYGPRAFDRL